VPQTKRFEQLCHHASVSLFMGFTAVASVILADIAGTREVSFVVPVNVRSMHPALEPVMGRFLNWIPLRMELPEDATCAELLALSKAANLAAYAHQAVPAPLVYGTDDVFGHPLSRVLLNSPYIGATTPEPFELANVRFTPFLQVPVSGARNDLALILGTKDEKLFGGMRGAAELFDASDVERLAARLKELLVSFEPSRKLRELVR
jgi:non-ribosomal peptide synthetase component F